MGGVTGQILLELSLIEGITAGHGVASVGEDLRDQVAQDQE